MACGLLFKIGNTYLGPLYTRDKGHNLEMLGNASLSSKGRTICVGKAILCRDMLSNILWNENGPCWGTIAYFIGGKEGQPSLITYVHSFSFHIFFGFYIGEEEKKSMMDLLERRRRNFVALTLYWWLHMIVHHVLDMQTLALNGEWKMLWFQAFALRVWRWEIKLCGHLREV
jgi:hypothetical protein